MRRIRLAIAGLILLAGCSGGGGSDPAPVSTTSAPAQPDMLTATSHGLQRGKANGQGQQLIFSHPNMHQQFPVEVSEGNVFYPRQKTEFDADIWTVRTDGTGDRALLNTTGDEHLLVANGPWVFYMKDIRTPTPSGIGGSIDQRGWNLRVDTGAQFQLLDNNGSPSRVHFHADRVIFQMDYEVFSEPVTGGPRIQLVASQSQIVNASRIAGDALTYALEGDPDPAVPFLRLFAVPLAGGETVALDSNEFATYSLHSIGNRVVYERCQIPVGPCDVVSIEANGTGRVVLASDPANESVQGVTTNQAIIRRNLSGNDQLIAVPVAGGPERLLMTMTNSEFVDLIIGDLLIIRRPSGTWSLDLNGTLKQLGTIAGDSGFVSVGNAVCLNRVAAVWCMPLDGHGEAVKIADTGRVVGVL